MPVPSAKLYLVEQSLLRRRARRNGPPPPALQARAKIEADRREQADAQKRLVLMAAAQERMVR